MPNIGPTELIIVLVIVLLVVGPKKLPSLGRSLGTGMREFKDSVTGSNKDEDEDALLSERPVAPAPQAAPRPQEQAAAPQPPATPPAPAPQPRDVD